MDSIQPVLQPLQRVWRGLSRGQQIGLGAVAAALAGLLFIVSTVGHGADSAIAFSGLSTDDEAAVVQKLKDAKIPYELHEGGIIRVPSGQVQEARLATAGLGLGGKPSTGSGFELFNQPSFGQTEFTQKVNYQRALENELARSIDQMDAVDTARVHLVIPERALFSSQQQPTTASVMLKLKPGKRLDGAQARSISNLVAGSVEGLKPQNLTIVDVNGNTLTPDDSASSTTGLSSKQLETQRGFETTTERNLQAMLDSVLGPGKATVRVAAVMNWDQIEQTSESYTPNDPTQTPVLTNHSITESSNGGAAGGAATSNKTETETTYQLNKTTMKTVRAPGAVTRLSVSVMLDDDPNNPNPALVQSVQNAVNAAAGIDPSRGDVLTVTSLPFNRQDLVTAQAAMDEAAQQERVMNYLHLAALAVGPLVMLVVLFVVLRRGRERGRKRGRKEDVADAVAPVGLEASAVAPEPVEVAETATPPAVPTRQNKLAGVAQAITEDPQKVYIREQIQMLGKANPATVAQLIQTWMDEDRRN